LAALPAAYFITHKLLALDAPAVATQFFVDLEDRRRVASVLTQKFDEYDQALTRMNPPLGLPLLCRHELAGAENCCANLDVTRNPFAA